jgi:hypothetical protein
MPTAAALTNFVQQHISLNATVGAGLTGSAHAQFAQTTAQTKSLTRTTAAPFYNINAALNGANADAQVTVTIAGTRANTAKSDINVEADATAPSTLVTKVNGVASLDAQLRLDGAATGSATVTGDGSYDVSGASTALANSIDSQVTGSVAGTVSISGSSAAGGSIYGLNNVTVLNPSDSDYRLGLIPSIPSTPSMDEFARSHLEANSRTPTAGPSTTDAFKTETVGYSNAIAKRGILSSGETNAAGIVDGSASSTAYTISPSTLTSLTGSASQDSTQSIGLETNFRNDRAIAYSKVYSESERAVGAVPAMNLEAHGEAATYASVSRSSTGTLLNYAQANIPSAVWHADVNTEFTPVINGQYNDPAVSIDGSNGFVLNNPALPGFRAAATLLNRKNTAATTFQTVTQSADYTSGTHTGTTNSTFLINLVGPRQTSVVTDAVGGWASAVDQSLEAGDAATTNSMTVADWNAIKWIQGQDSNVAAGYSSSTIPVQTPAGSTILPHDVSFIGPAERTNDFNGKANN